MPMPRNALIAYWTSIRRSYLGKTIVFNPDILGICARWQDNPFRYGPPMTHELSSEDGGVVQVFAHGAIEYKPGVGFIDHLS